MPVIPIEYTPHFAPLVNGTPYDFANIYGGRASMKTETTARLALALGINRDMRICFARETMSSMKESSHETLTSIIYAHEMAVSQNGPYRVLEDRIQRRDGEEVKTEFIFVGIRERVRDSKGLHGIDLTVVEEAAKVSKDSWTVFIPTVMRKGGSKMWVVWNPELVSDNTYERFIISPPSNCIQIYTTYLDNPWASEITKQLAEDCKRDTPEDYEHIWLGRPKSELSGAIYREEMNAAFEKGRICAVPYNRQRPVDTAWDLGLGDPTCIWFIQQYEGYWNCIDYVEFQDVYLPDIMQNLQGRGYVYGTHYLPWDGNSGMIHKHLMGIAIVKDHTASPQSVIRSLGQKAECAPQLLKYTSIDAARGILPNTRFDAAKCSLGIDRLRFYKWDREPGADGKRKPYHPTSHGAEAFQTAALAIKPKAETRKSANVVVLEPDDEEFAWG